jgi:thymidylate synthase
MKEAYISGETLPIAYHEALKELHTNGPIVECPDWDQKQKEMAMTVCVAKPLAEPRISRLVIGGPYDLQRYEMEMLDGILDFRVGSGWDYTYHERFGEWLPFVIEELKRNPYSRRAIISIRDNKKDANSNDPACLQSIQYFIRNGALDCMVMFRSNDLPEAFYFNAWALIRLQEKTAAELGVAVGTYTHRSNSMHCYEKDFKLLQGFADGIKNKPLDDLTYNYEKEYKGYMEETIPEIWKLVKQLKGE